jgi:osmotically-inducible protein OsmY
MSDPHPMEGRAVNVLLVGASSMMSEVAAALGRIDVEVAQTPDIESAVALANEKTIALVVVPPLDVLPAERALRRLRSSQPTWSLPVFVVVPDDAPGEGVRRLYREGASQVFTWPSERGLFPRIALEAPASTPHESSVDPDRALAEAIRSRVLLRHGGGPVHIGVTGGDVRLIGVVDTLREREKLAAIVSAVPGVRRVRVDALEVSAFDRSDAELAATVRIMLRAADAPTGGITTAVHDSHLFLCGTVPTEETAVRIRALLSRVRGVQEIHDATEVIIERRPSAS